MMKPEVLVTVILYSISLISAANILAIFPLPSPSHHIWNSPLIKSLVKRGHTVTLLNQLPQETPHPNLRDLVVPEILEGHGKHNFEEDVGESLLFSTGSFMDLLKSSCKKILKSKQWAQVLESPPDTKFDLVIIEPMGTECLLGILPRFGNPPIITINAFNAPTWMLELVGSPNLPSNIPHHHLPVTDEMTFLQRVQNFYYSVYTYYRYHYDYIPEMEKAAQEFYGSQIPSFYEIRKRVSLGMANFHPVLDYGFARTPNLIPIAGIQVEDPKPLPRDLQKFLDDATDGAIYFSFGSNIFFNLFSSEKIKLFLEAFSDIPQRVLWKFESDSLPGQSKNVKIGKWLPQSDILAHPNVKLFITHSGLLSTHEAIFRGVPIIGIPIFGEQPINIFKMVNHGAGIQLSYRDLTKVSLLKAIRTVLGNSSYAENVKKLSAKLQDDPQTPLERAVFWTEYVLRHNGAYHLQSGAQKLNLFQYYLYDIIILVISIPVIIIHILCYTFSKNREAKDRKRKRS